MPLPRAVVFALLTTGAAVWGAAPAWAQRAPRAQETVSGLARAVAGDRLEIAGKRVKLFGIATPALSAAHGTEAMVALYRLVQDAQVHCHLLRQGGDGIWEASCERGGEDLSAAMVRQGWAKDCPTASRGRYKKQEQEALAAGAGFGETWEAPGACKAMKR